MLLCPDTRHPALAGVLHGHRIEEIGEIPALPAGGDLWYPRSAQLEPGGTWFLRSSGTDFTIIPRAWLRHGLRRCYSVGCDLDPQGERDGLLLLQVFTGTAEAHGLAAALTAALAGLTERLVTEVGEVYGQSCLRLSAHLRWWHHG